MISNTEQLHSRQVLESLDFQAAGFGVILVEADGYNTTKDDEVRNLLEAAGYSHIGHHQRSDWFVNDKWEAIYAGVGLQRPIRF